MAKKEEELYKEWVKEIESGLETDEQRNAFEIFKSTNAAREALRGGMRRGEFDRRLNELHETRRQLEAADEALKSKHEELNKWYQSEAPKNAALVEQLEELRSKLREFGDEGNPPPSRETAAQLPFSKEKLEALEAKANKVDAIDQYLPRLTGEMFAIMKKSIQEGFDVDPRDIIQYAAKNRVDTWRAYEDLTMEARQEKFEKDREDEKKKWLEEGRKSALSSLRSSPDHIRTPGPNVVDLLKDEKTVFANKSDRVNAAVKEFLEMGAQ